MFKTFNDTVFGLCHDAQYFGVVIYSLAKKDNLSFLNLFSDPNIVLYCVKKKVIRKRLLFKQNLWQILVP